MDNPSIMSHVSLGTNDLERARAFYVPVLATIGAKIVTEHDDAIAFGKAYPEFWVQKPFDKGKAQTANGVHFGFWANDKDEVHAFYQTALELGGRDDGEPGPRKEYGEPYYGCFVYDPDGHKIEAAYWDMELAARLQE